MNLIADRPNRIGIIASTLCLIHCLATPILFIAKLCSTSSSICLDGGEPIWWRWFDYLFLLIALLAVYHSAKVTGQRIIAVLLWFCWSFLFFVIINEQFGLLSAPHELIYIPTISLIILHIYNRKFDSCAYRHDLNANTEDSSYN